MRFVGARNVRVRLVAVGSKEGWADLRWKSENGDFLHGHVHVDQVADPNPGNLLRVPTVSIDDDLETLGINPRGVGFVKIDVEGAELEVLRGASRLLEIGRPAVFAEVEPRWTNDVGRVTVEDVFNHMERHGYLPYVVTAGGVEAITAEGYSERYHAHLVDGYIEAYYNNVLFLPQVDNC